MALHVNRWGTSGSVAVLVHGDVADGEASWGRQRVLADRRRLLVVDRPGHGGSPARRRVDFEDEAELVAEVMPSHAHLVGHSYGAVVCLYVAARWPERVTSLTVSEPPAYWTALPDPRVSMFIAKLEELWDDSAAEPGPWFARFAELIGERKWPRGLAAANEPGVRLLMNERPPWEAKPNLQRIRDAGLPTLVLSSGGVKAFELTCDAIAEQTGARREVIVGAGHNIPRRHNDYNPLLSNFWDEVEHAEGRASCVPVG